MTAERPNEQALALNFEFEALHHADNYRKALIEEFGPRLKGRVLEVGAGIGQMTEMIARCQGVREVIAVEPEPAFFQQLQARVPECKAFCGTSAALPADTSADAVVSVNVLEHIREDQQELQRYHGLLAGQGGNLCLFVPARPEIYAPLDKDFGHHRRYSRPGLRRKLQAAGFQIERLHYFNWAGYFAWWLYFRMLKKRAFETGSVRVYDRMIFPVVHWMEQTLCRPPLGQSLLAVASVGKG
jgi:SAM-dependent methyltransferase